jgi:hypothetical protein
MDGIAIPRKVIQQVAAIRHGTTNGFHVMKLSIFLVLSEVRTFV